jgi:hypothetical protein
VIGGMNSSGLAWSPVGSGCEDLRLFSMIGSISGSNPCRQTLTLSAINNLKNANDLWLIEVFRD